MANNENSVLTPKQWLTQNLLLTLSVLWASITSMFATKDELYGVALYPVDTNALTPTSTFVANAVLGINGVIYRAKRATSHFPVALQVSGNAFVVNTVDGEVAFVITDPTVHADWEPWTDCAMKYWKSQLDARITAIETASPATALQPTTTYGGIELSTLLTECAKLVNKTVVINGQ